MPKYRSAVELILIFATYFLIIAISLYGIWRNLL